MKLKIKVIIKNQSQKIEKKYNAILKNSKIIKYMEKENTKVQMDMERLTLTRENNQFKMEYNFKTGRGKINMKELKRNIELPILVEKILYEKNQFLVEYKIDKEKFTYSIEWRSI